MFARPPIQLLIVEDSPADTRLLVEHVRRSGYEVQWQRVETHAQMTEALTQPWDAIVSDNRLPAFSAREALQLYRQSALDIPFLIVSGTIGEVAAVECMRSGAHDYVLKGNLARFMPALERELQEAATRRRCRAAEQALVQAESEKKRFCRELLQAVSQGKLQLVDPEEIARPDPVEFSVALEQREALVRLRDGIRRIGHQAGMLEEPLNDLLLAAGEAASNAIKHGREGFCEVRLRGERLSILILDRGDGIRPEDLPTVLQPGFSTKVSLGMGYTLMLQLADRVQLATGPGGTVVNLEKMLGPAVGDSETAQALALLERFSV